MEMKNHSMDRFCGSTFWDTNLTWNTEDPDLTNCFQNTVLVWTPCAFLWVFSGLEVYFFLNSKRRNVPYTWRFYSKAVLTAGLITLSIADIGKVIYDSNYKTVFSVDWSTPIIKILTFTLSGVLLHFNRRYGMCTSGLLFLFWCFLALCEIPRYRSLLRSLGDQFTLTYTFGSFMVYYPMVVIIFLLNFFSDPEPQISVYQSTEKPCPEQRAAFPSKMLFVWFDPMAWKGFKKPLESSDLWSMNPEDTAREIVPRFEKHWNKGRKKLENIQRTNTSSTNEQSESNKKRKKKDASVVLPLCKTFAPLFISGAVLKLATDIMTFLSPYLLNLLIGFIDGHEEMWKGYFYASMLLLSASIQTVLISQYNNQMFLVGLRIRTALIAAIYRKAMKMSNAAKKEATVGEIVNLMSVDAQRFTDLTPNIHLLWSAPLQIAMALYFLWQILGPSVFAGLAVMIILIPINGVIGNKFSSLQIRQMSCKDDRVKLMNEVLNGIKVLKLYAWEKAFEEQILSIRKREMKLLKGVAYLTSALTFAWTIAPFLVSLVSFGTFVLIDEKNILDSKTAFVSLSLFNILRFPLSMLPMMIGSLIQTWVSVKRINVFMNTEGLDPDNVDHDESENNAVVIENGSFFWDVETGEKPTLHNINLQVKPRQLIAVVGTVGSGKSSLISAVLGEMDRASGRVNTKGSIAYVSQQAWIQNATLQDNILFAKPLEKTFYDRVVEACALAMDLKMLPAGDQTEIGEKGINLSGGQKQRVALARAVYNDADIYLFDDPLSAVDSHVGKHIFENIIGPTGLLKNKTRLLVTHGITYLPEVDNIVVLKDGEITEIGTYKQLLANRGAFADFLIQHLQEVKPDEDSDGELDVIKQQLESTLGANELQRKLSRTKSRDSTDHSDVMSLRRKQSMSSQNSKTESLHGSNSIENSLEPKIGEKIIEVEKAEIGSVKLKVYIHYLKAVGWVASVLTLVMYAMLQSFNIGANVWLAKWSDDNTTVLNGIVDVVKRDTYLGVYGALGFGQTLGSFFGYLAPMLGCWLAARQMHIGMLHGIIRAPLTFFDTTPTGRIISRFAKDVDVLDSSLPQQISGGVYCAFEVIATLVVISLSTPIFIAVIIPIVVVYYFLQRFYVATSRQLKRLESVSRSPIYSHFGESLIGAQTIRAYRVQDRFIFESEQRVDFNQVCCYASIVATRWLAIRLEMIGNLIIFFAALFAVLERDTMSAGLVGLSVSYSLQITQTLNWLVLMAAEVETDIVAVERIKEYSETRQEAAWEIADRTPPKDWPSQGLVEFRDFKVRYREGLDLVLNGLTFTVNGGEKIGIVGRTGAGKSSLTLSLFRIIEAANGCIRIDGIDISKLGLHALRSRLTIIPQDPVLFSGSLRLNLDPFDHHTDEEIWRALEHAHLKEFVKSLPTGLLHAISEGGENLSVGQRQLICLARALLRKTKILILDEATAAVDLETDDLIQRTIRQEFKDCTVLTIAHRLNTILDSDRVIVLDQGYISEFESPGELLAKPNSAFYSMAKDAGLAT